MHDGESEQATARVVMAKRAIAERLVLMLALAVVDLMGRVEDILLRIGRRSERDSHEAAKSPRR